VTVSAPATSANLGPGFDAFGLALGVLTDEVTVAVTDGGLTVEVVGEGAAEVPRDERHLVVRAVRAGLAAVGLRPPGLWVRSVNRIPHARGLGSSASAVVAGLSAAFALAGRDLAETATAQVLLELATGFEGHPDNVAACLLGGLTVAWTGPDGSRAVRVPLGPGVHPIALVPAETSLTQHARTLLPATVPHSDAAANAGRAALLVLALGGRPELLMPATEDWLHQHYRAAEMPASAALIAALRAAGIPAVVSGAGPTVLAFPPAGVDLASVVAAGFTVVDTGIAQVGVHVVD
jgi:homoserine kinase